METADYQSRVSALKKGVDQVIKLTDELRGSL